MRSIKTRRMKENAREAPAPVSGVPQRGVVLEILPSGEILVGPDADRHEVVRCERLENGESFRVPYERGDRVIFLPASRKTELACVLGRVGVLTPAEQPDAGRRPTERVLRAEGRLKIVCGQASITLQEDGKILIDGVEVVSKAKGSNRIKGASVRIN